MHDTPSKCAEIYVEIGNIVAMMILRDGDGWMSIERVVRGKIESCGAVVIYLPRGKRRVYRGEDGEEIQIRDRTRTPGRAEPRSENNGAFVFL